MAAVGAPFADVGVVKHVVARRVGGGKPGNAAKIGDQKLVVGQLGAVGVLPAREEGCGGQRWRLAGCEVMHDVRWVFGHVGEYAIRKNSVGSFRVTAELHRNFRMRSLCLKQ